jgi:hypothetical protein
MERTQGWLSPSPLNGERAGVRGVHIENVRFQNGFYKAAFQPAGSGGIPVPVFQ